MPAGMCLRSNWGASHIADPRRELTLDAYCRQNGNHVSRPIPLERFVDYGHWYQRQAVPDLDRREVQSIEALPRGFRIVLSDRAEIICRRVVVAAGIGSFVRRPVQFDSIPADPGLPCERTRQPEQIQRSKDYYRRRWTERFGIGGFAQGSWYCGRSNCERENSQLGRPAPEIASPGPSFEISLFVARRWPSWNQPPGGNATLVS